eukprot:tig00000017_g10.t1
MSPRRRPAANVGARNRVECADAGFDAFLAVRPPARHAGPAPGPRSRSRSAAEAGAGKELAMEEALVAAAGASPLPRASASAEVAGAPPAAIPIQRPQRRISSALRQA